MTDRDSDKENRDRAKRLLLAAGPPQWHHFPRGKGKRIELDASGDQNDLVRIWAYLRDAVSKDRNKLAHGTGRSPEQLLPLLHSLVARAKDRGKLGDLLQDDALDPSNLRLLLKRFQPAIPDRNLLDLAVKRALELCS